MMAQEPWCKLPHEFARLTDWQLLNLYYLPALKRSQQQSPLPSLPDAPRLAPGPELYEGEPHVPVSVVPAEQMTHPPVGSPEFKAWYVRVLGPWYGTKERAEAEYEAQLNEWKYAPADAWWRKAGQSNGR